MSITLRSKTEADDVSVALAGMFDIEFTGETETTIAIPDVDSVFPSWSIGCVVGPSGTGKTTIARSLARDIVSTMRLFEFDPSKTVASYLGDTPTEAMLNAASVGMHSIPSLLRPFHVLSQGEQQRTIVGRVLRETTGGVPVFVDEYCSCVDRHTAASLSRSLARTLRSSPKPRKVIFVSTNVEALAGLSPCWAWDTRLNRFVDLSSYKPVAIELSIDEVTGGPAKTDAWKLFAPHHYMSGSLNTSARCFIATDKATHRPVAFRAVLAQPCRVKNLWRGHRLVVLPEYQGLGIGPQMDEHVGELLLQNGKRFISRTIHPRLGEYRERSPLWKATTKNRVVTKLMYGEGNSYRSTKPPLARLSYSHEYVGREMDEE
jgi:GNAT superfamily N-acetyltransferase